MVAALPPTPLPGDIEDGTVDTTRGFHLLASMKFGTQFSTQSDGRQVLITPEHQLLCEHGETSFTIRHWLTAERNAEKQGLPFPPRGGSRGSGISTCTCQTTEGLNVKLSDSIELPSRCLTWRRRANLAIRPMLWQALCVKKRKKENLILRAHGCSHIALRLAGQLGYLRLGRRSDTWRSLSQHPAQSAAVFKVAQT